MSERRGTDNSGDSTEEVPFTTQGRYKDEVIVIFDDETKLYVPVSFLTLSSPVFEAMFSSDFKEKQEMEVKLPGKTGEDFLEFLLCIHPRILKPIQETNVLRVAPIAEEYQVFSLITTCQDFMKIWLERQLKQTEKEITNWAVILDNAKLSIEIFYTASILGYTELCTFAAGLVAKYPYRIYESSENDTLRNIYGLMSKKETIAKCRERFSSLPIEWKYAIASKRLLLFEQNEFKI